MVCNTLLDELLERHGWITMMQADDTTSDECFDTMRE